MPITIKTEAEFQSFMLTIDEKLKDENAPIPSRELLALREAAMMTGQSLRGAPLPNRPEAGNYCGDNLSLRVFEWMKATYGKRLAMSFNIGEIPIRLGGEVWRLSIPLMYGQVRVLCDPDLERQYPQISSRTDPTSVATINLLRLVDALTTQFASRLAHEDMLHLTTRFQTAYAAFSAVDHAGTNSELMRISRTDLVQAAKFATDHPPQLGLSRWAALQGAEKAIKAYISHTGTSFPTIHNLQQLMNTAVPLGLPIVPANTIGTVQCTASVRYDQSQSTIEQVIAAHSAALLIAHNAAAAML